MSNFEHNPKRWIGGSNLGDVEKNPPVRGYFDLAMTAMAAMSFTVYLSNMVRTTLWSFVFTCCRGNKRSYELYQLNRVIMGVYWDYKLNDYNGILVL